MIGSPLARAPSISDLMYSRATQLSSPQEVRQRLIDSKMGSGRSPQNAQLTSITSNAGRFPNPARAPNPPAANTALSRSVRNLSQIRSLIDLAPSHRPGQGRGSRRGIPRDTVLIASHSSAALLHLCPTGDVDARPQESAISLRPDLAALSAQFCCPG